MKVSTAKIVKSKNGVMLLVERYGIAAFDAAAGEVIVRAATTESGSWAEVHRFKGSHAEGLAFAKAASVVVTGERKAHIA